jgi:DNA-binding response OmpR family regulator
MTTKVLVIEDDERTRRLYKAAMAFQSINVATAANASAGFKKFLSFKPDLVILDIMLSGDGEMNIIKKFREHGATHTLPVIILTDLKDESIRKEASIIGACEYLVKSENSIGDLITKVRTILKIEVGQGAKSTKK